MIGLHKEDNKLKEFEKAVLRRHILLKRLGDGLAWILTGYNRAYIRALGRKEPTGFIFGKSGFELERLALEAVFDEKKQRIGILHDLTNCLRTGDLTVMKFGKSPTILRCLELKAVRNQLSNIRKRERRQEKCEETAWNYVRTGKSSEIHPGFTTISAHLKLTNHWSKMKLLLLKAKNSGYAYELIEDALLYVAIDPQILPTAEVVYKQIKQIEPPFIFGCLDRFKDDLFDHEPIFTFELDADQVLDIIFERLSLCIFLSLGKLKQLLKKEGFDLLLPINTAGPQEGLKIRDEHGEEALMGPYPIEMLLYEGVDIKSFIDGFRLSNELRKKP